MTDNILGELFLFFGYVYFVSQLTALLLGKRRWFLGPTLGKIIVFLIILSLANLNGMGYTETKIMCVFGPCPPISQESNFLFYPFTPFTSQNPTFVPPIIETLQDLPRILSSNYLANFILAYLLNITYWYLLSCLIVWLLRKSVLKK